MTNKPIRTLTLWKTGEKPVEISEMFEELLTIAKEYIELLQSQYAIGDEPYTHHIEIRRVQEIIAKAEEK